MNKLIVLVFTLFAVTACVASPTLQEKIAGKSDEERTAIVRQECYNEANKLRNSPKNVRTSSHATHVREICEVISAVK